MLNANPTVFAVSSVRRDTRGTKPRAGSFAAEDTDDDESVERFDALEIFEHLRHINDPEHPLTLEQLKVVQLDLITVSDEESSVAVSFTPTIPHCSMATLIGLCIRVKLIRSLPRRFKVDVFITPGTHASEAAVNKQLNDKERVAAALENQHLLNVVNKCIADSHAGRSLEGSAP
jgi:metal-sulfur cluster biosynthetic enzyme